MTTYADLFTGFGGATLGAMNAGLTPLWGIELDPAIAEVASTNLGHRVHIANILDCDPFDFDEVTVLHASPPCPNFSVANANGSETALDIALAGKVIAFVTTLKPRIFTLENVIAYRHSHSWRMIEAALMLAGYWLHVDHCNAADMGGLKLCPIHDSKSMTLTAPYAAKNFSHVFPQRMAPDIAAAFATMPSDAQATRLAWDAATHLVSKTGWGTAGSAGWHASENAQVESAGQKTTLGREVDISTSADMFVSGSMENIDVNIALLLKRCLDAPLLKERWFTISTETRKITVRKILESIQAMDSTPQSITKRGRWSTPIGASETNGCPLCHHETVPQTRKRMIVRAIRGGFVPYLPEPVPWVGWYSAIEDLLDTLPESQFAPWQLARLPELLATTLVAQGGFERTIGMTASHLPSPTITASDNQLRVRAFLMAGGGNTNFVQAHPGKGCRYADEPAHTVTTVTEDGGAMPRAWLVSGGNQTREMTIREDDKPSHTVVAWSDKAPSRSLLSSGRVVSMSVRALARFQSFPDWYQFSGNNRLDAKGIGNAVCPLLYQRIIEPLVEGL